MRFKFAVRYLYFLLRGLILALFFRRKAISGICPDRVRAVAALRIDRIGDVVVSLPALKALKDVFPQCRLSLILRERNLPLLRGIPWIDELIPYKGFWDTVRVLRSRRFNLVVDLLMEYSLKTAWLAYLSKAVVTVGFDLEGRGRLFTAALKPAREKKLMSQYLLDLVRSLAGLSGLGEEKIKDSVPELKLSDEDAAFAVGFLREKGIEKGGLIIVLHPGGYFPSQRWKVEGFAQLADELVCKYQAKIIIVAAADEEEMVRRLIGLMKIKPCVVLGLGLGKSAAIIAQGSIFIGTNSGLLHIAAALGRPTVSTMGPTVPWLWMPQGNSQVVLRHNLECSPCNLGVCKKHRCMELITVEEIERAVDDLLKKENTDS